MKPDPKTTPISCIILAGGAGKRFGNQDKGFVLLDDKPLIEHTVERIRPQVDEIIISANRNFKEYRDYSDSVISDEHDGFQGPLTGIVSCLPHCGYEWALIVPCDLPFLPIDLVKRLCAGNESDIVIVETDGEKQLVFLMHASLLSSLQEYIESGNRKVMSWIEQLNPSVVSFNDESDSFLNINSEDQLPC